MFESAMQDMMNFWPGPVDICQGEECNPILFRSKDFSVLFDDSVKLSNSDIMLRVQLKM